jgi:aspartyl protease family protein
MNRLAVICGAIALAAALSASAQTLTKCVAGQRVVDQEGKIGTIMSEGSPLCQVRYDDGQAYGWIFWNLRPVSAGAKPGAPGNPGGPRPAITQPPQQNAAPTGATPDVTVLRPVTTHSSVYRAGPNGHFLLKAAVNGAPVRFLVDTGATLVFLTPDDARAVGISPSELEFKQPIATGNGTVRAAPVLLREIRLDGLSLGGVQAAVIEHLGQSVLGMSFLSQLKGFEMREGSLTINW